MIDPARFERISRIDSTNAELMRRPFAQYPQAPCVLLADEQQAGRGRNGRTWIADPRASLTMSVAVEHAVGGRSLMGLSLGVGVCIAQVLHRAGPKVRLKWPNDLYLDTPQGLAKAGGILIEVRHVGSVQRIVAGCGLNLLPAGSIEASQTGQPSAALFEAASGPDRVQLAQELGHAIVVCIGQFMQQGFAVFAPEWRTLDLLEGRRVRVMHPQGHESFGVACGVDEEGALVVQFDDGHREHCVGGDVSVRMNDGPARTDPPPGRPC